MLKAWESSIGHFRVPKNLTFKARLSAKPLIWKWVLIMMQIKLIFTTKVSHLASFWKWDFLELGNGLLKVAFWGYFLNVKVNWENIYQLPFLCTTETKLRVFQFKFLHRRIAITISFLRLFLSWFPRDTYAYFWDCRSTQTSWNNVSQWINHWKSWSDKHHSLFTSSLSRLNWQYIQSTPTYTQLVKGGTHWATCKLQQQVAATDHSMYTGREHSCCNTLRRRVAATNRFVCTSLIENFCWNLCVRYRIWSQQRVAKILSDLIFCDMLRQNSIPECVSTLRNRLQLSIIIT